MVTIDSSLINILLILGLPYLISGARSFFTKTPPTPLQRARQAAPPPKPSRWYRFVLSVLALASIYHLLITTVFTLPNVFKALSLPPDCPHFILTQSWNDRAEADKAFAQLYPSTPLYERFRAMENRFLYEIFGQDAFLGCEHCSEKNDYYIYIFPAILGSYVGMGMLIGLATSQISRPNRYRTWGSVLLAALGIVEYSVISRGSDLENLANLKIANHTLIGVTGGYTLRHFSLALMSVEMIINRHRTLQLARVASLRDPMLRKQFIEYWKRREVEHSLLTADEEYKEARSIALSKIDVETVVQETN
ncbi:hypothetical protein BGW38_005011, partial [Lunasporangiospora selenospora]